MIITTSVQKVLIGSFATIVLLTLWKTTYQYSCWSLFFPFLILLFVGIGQFEHLLLQKRCRVNCMFKQNSLIYRVLTGKILLIVSTVFFTILFTIPLVTFIALASKSDLMFTLASLTITAFLYPLILKASKHHVIDGMSTIMAKHVVIILSLIIMLAFYTYISFYHISFPSYLDPTSLKNTVDASSQSISSLCPSINLLLKWSQETEATLIFGTMVASKNSVSSGISIFYWFVLFLHHSLVFAALAKLQVELISQSITFNSKGNIQNGTR